VQVRTTTRQPALEIEDQDRTAVVALGDDAKQIGHGAPLTAPDTGPHRLLPRRCLRRWKNRRGWIGTTKTRDGATHLAKV
jgi:hypothetical protein